MFAFLAGIDWGDVAEAGVDTVTMLGWALGFTVLIGLPLGVILYLTGQPRLLYAPLLHRVLSLLVNVMRSLPFIILLIVMIPLTTLITGTSLGVQGTIPPLVAGCAPFFARLVETSLREVDHGLVEASWAMGGSTWQLIWYTLLPESRSGLIAAVTVTAIAGGLHLDGRGHWRRWAGGFGHPFWLSTLSNRRHGGHGGVADCAGTGFTNERRPSGTPNEP